MAEDKKSFVMYCDWQSTFEELEDDEAGRLIKHILRYVNDQEPDPPDKLTKLLFEPIKNQFKRDLKKWIEKSESKSSNGKLGNLKRWNKDLYDLVVAKAMSIETAEIIAKDRKLSLGDSSRSLPIANIAVIDNVIDTVTVNDNVNDTEVNTPSSFFQRFDLNVSEVGEFLKSEQAWKNPICMQLKITTEQIDSYIEDFENTLKGRGETNKTPKDAKEHFYNWINGKLKNGTPKTGQHLPETEKRSPRNYEE